MSYEVHPQYECELTDSDRVVVFLLCDTGFS